MQSDEAGTVPQYSLIKILLIWAAATIPMGILGWVIAPALAQDPQKPGFERLAVLMIGLIWQFILAMFLLYKETGNLRWQTIRQRFWLRTPQSARNGKSRARLWWLLIPIILITAVYQILVSGTIDKFWVSLLPWFAEPSGFALGAALETQEIQAQMVGSWDIWWLFIVFAVFNTFLGEELLFRGLLLPRMSQVFGKWDWVANGVLFGLYHIHQPWMILSGMLGGMVLFALPSRYFRSNWFGIIAHSGQSIFLAIILFGLVMGWAQ